MGKILFLYKSPGKPIINECFLTIKDTAVECINRRLDYTQTFKPLSVSRETSTSYRMCPKNVTVPLFKFTSKIQFRLKQKGCV